MVPKNMTLAPALIVPSFIPHIYRMSNATAKQIKKLVSVIRLKLTILFTVFSLLFINTGVNFFDKFFNSFAKLLFIFHVCQLVSKCG